MTQGGLSESSGCTALATFISSRKLTTGRKSEGFIFFFIFIVSQRGNQSPAMKKGDGNDDIGGKKMVLQIFFFLH